MVDDGEYRLMVATSGLVNLSHGVQWLLTGPTDKGY